MRKVYQMETVPWYLARMQKWILAAAFLGAALAAAQTPGADLPAGEPLPGKPPTDAELSALVKRLGDSGFQVREEASRQLLALGRKFPLAVYPALQSSDKDPEIQIRLEELRKGTRKPYDDARLLAEIESSPEGVKTAVAAALEKPTPGNLDRLAVAGKRDPSAACAALVSLLDSPDEEVQRNALVALGALAEKPSAGAVARLLQSDDMLTSDLAAEVLGKITGNDWPSNWERHPDGSFSWRKGQDLNTGGVVVRGGANILVGAGGKIVIGGQAGSPSVMSARAFWSKHKDDPEYQPKKPVGK